MRGPEILVLIFALEIAGALPAAGQSFFPAPAQFKLDLRTTASPGPDHKFRFLGRTSAFPASGAPTIGERIDFRFSPGKSGRCGSVATGDYVPGCREWEAQSGGQSSGSSTPPAPVNTPLAGAKPHGIYWGSVLLQSFEFLAVEHSLRMAFDPPSRREMQGKFWKDYVNSIKTLHGWSDGNHFFVNYVGHPLQGAASGWILIQNDPKGRVQRFGGSKNYWISRAKGLGWSTVYSLYWELGFPLSEAAIGNLGPEGRPGLGAVDLVITETVGTAYLITEDFLDRYAVRAIENKWCNPIATVLARSIFNINRSFANVLRWKYPWYRDDRGGARSCGN